MGTEAASGRPGTRERKTVNDMTRSTHTTTKSRTNLNRRNVLHAAAGAGGLAVGGALRAAPAKTAPAKRRRTNFLLIITDQQGLDTLSALGCRHVATPYMDRLAREGTSFAESYTSNPLCSPARSSIFTGRPTLETGVVVNGRPIPASMPSMGTWFRAEGYQTLYAGKWHLPASYTPNIPGFDVIATGINGQGGVCDSGVSRACEAYLRSRTGADRTPFLLVASFLQPHDICQFVSMHTGSDEMVFYDAVADQLPPLPANFQYDPREPASLKRRARPKWSEKQWRYYLWNYYRMIEMVDAEIGRLLDALDDSGEAANTVVVFTADHGEGRGRHQLVTKNFLYDEAAKVPLVIRAAGRVPAGRVDREHLVSGMDILPTLCDFGGVKTPPNVRGLSLRPVLEDKAGPSHEFVAAEVTRTGRMIRTRRYKYITYINDPVEQLFDMQADSGETKNLAGSSAHASALAEHRKLLAQWQRGLDVYPVEQPKWARPRKPATRPGSK